MYNQYDQQYTPIVKKIYRKISVFLDISDPYREEKIAIQLLCIGVLVSNINDTTCLEIIRQKVIEYISKYSKAHSTELKYEKGHYHFLQKLSIERKPFFDSCYLITTPYFKKFIESCRKELEESNPDWTMYGVPTYVYIPSNHVNRWYYKIQLKIQTEFA